MGESADSQQTENQNIAGAEDSQADNHQESQDQSSQSDSKEEEKIFTDSFGNKYTAEEFQAKFNEISSSFTKKAEEAKRYKQELESLKGQAQADAKKAVDESEVLKNMPPEVKLAVQKIVEPMFEEFARRQQEAARQAEADRAFEAELQRLEKEFDGSNGLPKFDRQKILEIMQQSDNKIFDPFELYKKINEKAWNEYIVKQALKDRDKDIQTENTGSGQRTPPSKRPKTFQEAARAFYARLTS